MNTAQTTVTPKPVEAKITIPVDYFAIGLIAFLLGYTLCYKSMSAVMPKQVVRNPNY